MLTRRVEGDLGRAFHRHLQVVLVGGKKHGIAIHVARQRGGLFALETRRMVSSGNVSHRAVDMFAGS